MAEPGRSGLPDRDVARDGANEMLDIIADEVLTFGRARAMRQCPCGVMRTAAPAFHRRSTNHDCVHHPRYRCWTCKGADRLIAGVEARLWAEVEHGPFLV